MHRILVFAMFGFLTLGGALHFVIDVLAQYLRHKRSPGPETTLYYGLNTSYALSQVLFGVLGLIVARHALELASRWSVLSLALAAAVCWLVFGFVFIEYREPRIMAAIFGALVIAVAVTR